MCVQLPSGITAEDLSKDKPARTSSVSSKRVKQIEQLKVQIEELEGKLQPTHGFMLKASPDKIKQSKRKLLDLYAELNMLQQL